MQDIEIEKVNSIHVSCSGKEEVYDHPKIYLKIDPKIGNVYCPYCSKKFEI